MILLLQFYFFQVRHVCEFHWELLQCANWWLARWDIAAIFGWSFQNLTSGSDITTSSDTPVIWGWIHRKWYTSHSLDKRNKCVWRCVAVAESDKSYSKRGPLERPNTATLIISPKSILGNALMSTPLSQHDHCLRGNQSNPFRIVNLSSLLYYCDTTSCSAIGISFSKELNSAVVYLSVLASSSWPYWPWSFRQSFRLRYGMSFQVSSRNSFTVVAYFNPVGIQLTLKSRKESKQLSLSVVSWRHFFS